MIKINEGAKEYIIKKGVIRKKYIIGYLILIILLYATNLNFNLFKLIFKFNLILSFYFYYNKEIYESLFIEIIKINFEKKNIEINCSNANTSFNFSELEEIKIVQTQDTFNEVSFYSLKIKTVGKSYNFGSELTTNNLKKVQAIFQNEVIKKYVEN